MRGKKLRVEMAQRRVSLHVTHNIKERKAERQWAKSKAPILKRGQKIGEGGGLSYS